MVSLLPGVWLFCAGLPLVLALALLSPRLRARAVAATPWAAVPALLLALVTSGTVVVEIPWLVLGTRLGLDPTGRVFLCVAAALWTVCGLVARARPGESRSHTRFCAFVLISMAGTLGSMLAADAVTFFFAFSMMGFASCGLVMHDRRGEVSRAGRIYVGFIALGEAFLFVGIVGLVWLQGHAGFPAASGATLVSGLGGLFLSCVLVGFGIKVGAVPVHGWAPLAYRAAPVPAAAALSGPMLLAGILGWLRFLPLGAEPMPVLGLICVAGGFVSAFWGVFAGLGQRSARAALGYSSVSQMGLVTAAIGAGLLAPDEWPAMLPAIWLFAVHHALAKTALVLGVGLVSRGTMARHRGVALAGLVLPVVALAGVPFSSGAAAKTALKHVFDAGAGISPLAAHLLTATSVATMLLMMHVLALAWPRRIGMDRTPPLPAPRSWLALVSAVALWVWVPWWGGVQDAALESTGPSQLWSALWPPAAGLVMAWCAWRVPAVRRRLWALRIPSGDILVPILSGARGVGHASRALAMNVAITLAVRRWPERPGAHATAARLRAAEAGLQRWDAAGVLILGLTMMLLALMTFESW